MGRVDGGIRGDVPFTPVKYAPMTAASAIPKHAARRVLHVIPGLGVGGAERCLATLVSATPQKATPQKATPQKGAPLDHHIANLLAPADGPIADMVQESGVPVTDLELTGLRTLPRTVSRLARLIRETRPDVVQGWMYYGDLLATLALGRSGRRRDTRLIWGVRCSDMDLRRYGRRLRLTVRACARLSRRPETVIANSAAGRAAHIALGYHADDFRVIPNGIDTERFRPVEGARKALAADLGLDPGRPMTALVARVDPMKDHDTFLDIVASRPEVQFIAAGAGTEALPDRPNLRRTGAWSDMPALYPALDALLLTSAFGEGFPNVIGEAMACGVPVVTTPVGDAAEIVGDTGEIAPVGDAPALAAGLDRLLADNATARNVRRQTARARIVGHYSVARMLAAFTELYREG